MRDNLIPLLRKWKDVIILCGIILLGLAIRSYHINFPSIGYHNMKENEYLIMAQEMARTGEFLPSISYQKIKEKKDLKTSGGIERKDDFITRRIYFFNAFDDSPRMRLYPQPPLVSYQILFSWKILGENLWGPRLFNIMFGLLSILVTYFIALLLFGNSALGLFSAFLLSIMPLAVFFSRNLQPESPAFFFMLLGNLFYLKFSSGFRRYNLVLGGLSLSFAWLYKFSFLIGLAPAFFYFPYTAIFKQKKELLRCVLAFLLPFSVILLAFLWLKYIGQWEFQELSRIKLLEVFSFTYWQKFGGMIRWYLVGENFTPVYILLASIGIVLAFVNRKGLLSRFIIGWVLTIIPYAMIFSDYLNQHNYYQMPFLGLVCISSANTVYWLSGLVRKYLKKDLIVYLMIATAAISAPFVYGSCFRMYGTVFLGQDVAGESLREFTNPDERIFLLTHFQGYAIARYARRYVGWTDDLKDFQEKEQKFNIRYICVYPAEFIRMLQDNHPDLFKYIQENYHVKEVGLSEESKALFYLILEKGKGSNPETFLQSFSGKLQLRTVYKLFGNYMFLYSLRPPVPIQYNDGLSIRFPSDTGQK